jgi:hypothetical protein
MGYQPQQKAGKFNLLVSSAFDDAAINVPFHDCDTGSA